MFSTVRDSAISCAFFHFNNLLKFLKRILGTLKMSIEINFQSYFKTNFPNKSAANWIERRGKSKVWDNVGLRQRFVKFVTSTTDFLLLLAVKMWWIVSVKHSRHEAISWVAISFPLNVTKTNEDVFSLSCCSSDHVIHFARIINGRNFHFNENLSKENFRGISFDVCLRVLHFSHPRKIRIKNLISHFFRNLSTSSHCSLTLLTIIIENSSSLVNTSIDF